MENALLRLPFKTAYMFRPGFIEPKAGIRSKTAFYRLLYTLARPVTPLLRLAGEVHLCNKNRMTGRCALARIPRGHMNGSFLIKTRVALWRR